MFVGGMSSMIQQEVYNSTVAFTSCLYRISRSARGERLVLSWDFPGHAHSPAHVCGHLDSHAYVRVFQNPLWTSQSLGFHFKFLGAAFIIPNLYHCFRHLWFLQFLNNFFQLVFKSILWIGLFAQSEHWIRSNKTEPWEWSILDSWQIG